MKELEDAYKEPVNNPDLQEEPRPANSLQMKGGQGFRLRIGDYRVLYDIDDSSQIVNLRRIGHRREIYRDL